MSWSRPQAKYVHLDRSTSDPQSKRVCQRLKCAAGPKAVLRRAPDGFIESPPLDGSSPTATPIGSTT